MKRDYEGDVPDRLGTLWSRPLMTLTRNLIFLDLVTAHELLGAVVDVAARLWLRRRLNVHGLGLRTVNWIHWSKK